VVWLVVLAAVLVCCAVGVVGTIVSRSIAERQAVHDMAQRTDLLATSVVQPALTDAVATDTGTAREALDPLVRGRLLGGSLVRVKVWTPSGEIIYSDETRLAGTRFVLDSDARAAFTEVSVEANVTDLSRPENRYERRQGKLLEVYRPVWTPSGSPLLFEAYYTYDTVSERASDITRGFVGVLLSSMAALLLLMVPLGWVLISRAREGRRREDQLMLRAISSSDEERQRIAASLHDGPVQQLIGASLLAANEAGIADAERSANLHQVAAAVRDSVASLRSLLVDIYPPSLRDSGLAAALQDLAGSVGGTDAEVQSVIDIDTAESLPVPAQEAVFRVAQEALRNAIRHGRARRVRLELQPADAGLARLLVTDDGTGFDPSVPNPSGEQHFGLRLMADAAARCNAELAIASAPGEGTVVRLEVPLA
jgi:signal transduction histidine kinase